MNYIPLGKTGLKVSELGFGGIPIIRLDEEAAVLVLRRAYESGITFYDTANAYRDSEKKIGRAMGDVRDKIILATKTIRRDVSSAVEQLDNSLRMMKTDYIDIYQLHQISQEKDWEIVTGPGGALEAVVKAKEQGKQFCRRCEYCQPCPQGVMITAAMGYKVIAARMSPKVAIEFSKIPMESVTLCTECRECVDRCPYELPIPDMLKVNYDLYEQHKTESFRT